MSQIVESPARREVRAALKEIALGIKPLGIDEFDLQQLKKFNIRLDPMTLDEASDHKPCYFVPYPGHLLPEPKYDALGGSYRGLDDDDGTDHAFTRLLIAHM